LDKWNNVCLGELLIESKIPSDNPDPDKRITVRLNVEGVEKRPYRKETKGATKYYIRKAGQFIYGKQNLHKGAFGIIPEELDGFESTIDLPSFDIDKSKVLPEWLMLILTKDNFYKELESIASGSATKRIHPERLFQVKIPLPGISEQKEILKKHNKFKVYHREISNIINDSEDYINKLRKSILQEAVQGKLVPQDPNDEPASVLLEKIKEEKERLIKEGKIKKEKPLPPITEVEISHEIPKGWEWVRLGDIGDWGAGATPPRNDPRYYNGEILWLKTGELNDGYIDDSEEKITELALKECSLRLNKPGDVLIAMYGATIGKLGILNVEATTNQACCGCTPFSQVYNRYLFYLLLSLRRKFKEQGAGGAQPNISKQKIINTVVPLPPLNEQKRIAQKVDQLMELCDELEKNIEQSKQDSELLMQSVLQEAFNED